MFDCVVEGFEGGDCEDGAEGFFAGELGAVGDVFDEGWLDDVSLAGSSGEDGGAFGLCFFDHGHDFVGGLAGDEGTADGGGEHGVAGRAQGDRVDETLFNLLVDGVLDQDVLDGDADLSGVAERSRNRSLDGPVEVGVFADDDGRVAAEFEGDPSVGHEFFELPSDSSGAGETEHLDAGIGEGSLGKGGVAVPAVDDARWASGFVDDSEEG